LALLLTFVGGRRAAGRWAVASSVVDRSDFFQRVDTPLLFAGGDCRNSEGDCDAARVQPPQHCEVLREQSSVSLGNARCLSGMQLAGRLACLLVYAAALMLRCQGAFDLRLKLLLCLSLLAGLVAHPRRALDLHGVLRRRLRVRHHAHLRQVRCAGRSCQGGCEMGVSVVGTVSVLRVLLSPT